MAIDYDIFKEWAESRFDNVVAKGKEIRINSIFDPTDTKQHLWCSPSGGKKKRPLGVYHCFKKDEKGSLVRLIQLVDGCDFADALAVLKGESLLDLESKIEELYEWDDSDGPPILEFIEQTIHLPPDTHLISELPPNDWFRKRAEEFLVNRSIPSTGLYVCKERPYKARIIIPYLNKEGKIIYWNSRHSMNNAKLRYLGPPKECGVGKSDVVFFPYGEWPEKGSEVCICEGEFNAIALKLSGLNSAACGGKNMDEKQALAFKDYNIVICLDRDKAGWTGTHGMSNTVSKILIAQGDKRSLQFVRPPQNMGDWNDMFKEYGGEFVAEYIARARRDLDHQAPSGMVGDFFKYSDL